MLNGASTISILGACLVGLIMTGTLLVLYPIELVLVHTLIETPYGDSGLSASNRYTRVGAGSDPTTAEHSTLESDLAPSLPCDQLPKERAAFRSMQTRSFFSAWANLKTSGVRGHFRAFPAQLIYFLCHELLFGLLGGVHPGVQLLNRVQSDDPSGVSFSFSPLLIVIMVLVKILLIPLDVIITRQIIGKPDKNTWFGLLYSLLSGVGLKALSPIILPQLLSSAIPLLLQNLTTWLHFLYLRETTVHPGYYALFAILELCWQLFTLSFIVTPLTAVLYRAQTSVISHMPEFDAFISYPASYISPLAELKQIVEEEQELTSTWYGRYLRSFKVVVCTSVMVFLVCIGCMLLLVASRSLDL